MSISYTYLNKINQKNTKNFVFFSDESFKILNFKNLDLKDLRRINNLIENNNDKKKNLLHLNLDDKQNLILVKIKKNQQTLDNEKLGASFFDFLNSNSIYNLTFVDKNFLYKSLNHQLIDEFFHGVELKSYEFKKYK